MHLSQYDGPFHLCVRIMMGVFSPIPQMGFEKGLSQHGMHQHIERAPQPRGPLCVGTHQNEPDSNAELRERAREAEAMVAALQNQCADMTAELAHAQRHSLLPPASHQVLIPEFDALHNRNASIKIL